MKTIPLTRGYIALVDDCDYDRLRQVKWHASVQRNNVYAYGYTSRKSGERKCLVMHRVIMGANHPSTQVDHVNHDGLDNRRVNLRLCLNCENVKNARTRKDSLSGLRGVKPPFKSGWGWVARIRVNGNRLHLGTFASPAEAARAYDEAARKYHGEFANTNTEGLR